jgi:hypothetical protein
MVSVRQRHAGHQEQQQQHSSCCNAPSSPTNAGLHQFYVCLTVSLSKSSLIYVFNISLCNISFSLKLSLFCCSLSDYRLYEM